MPTELILFARLNDVSTLTMLAQRLEDLPDVRIMADRRLYDRRRGLSRHHIDPPGRRVGPVDRRARPLLAGTFALLDRTPGAGN